MSIEANKILKDERDLEYDKCIKEVKVQQKVTTAVELISFIAILVGEYFVFSKCILESNLINIISLGAIFATFGSALLSIFLVTENNKYSRVLTNVDILYRDILKIEPWRRWQFLARSSSEKNLDETTVVQKLDNPKVSFDVGSHKIDIYIPTVREDFYDLPSMRCFWLMLRNKKHFKTNVYGKREEAVAKSQFSSLGDYVMGWDCLFDIWKTVMLYKLSRYFLKVGAYIVFVSVFYSFAFESIYLFLK